MYDDSPSGTETASAAPPAAAGLTSTMARWPARSAGPATTMPRGTLISPPAVTMKSGLGPFYLQDPLHVPRYESVTRAAFLNIMGQNWRGALCADDEDAYIREHLDAAGGQCATSAAAPGAGHTQCASTSASTG
jgi:hypothetical protein